MTEGGFLCPKSTQKVKGRKTFHILEKNKKAVDSKINGFFGPSGAVRTLDPLVPNQVRYQLRYTRIFESIIAKKLRKVKNYELAKLWSKKAILTTIRKNDRCIHCAATARFSDDIKIILLGKFPKQARYQLR